MAGASAIVFLPDDSARTGLDRPLWLHDVMGSPLLSWICGALYRSGTRRLLLVCQDSRAAQALQACPKSIRAITASSGDNAQQLLDTFLQQAQAQEEIITVFSAPVLFTRWTAFLPSQEPQGPPGAACGVWDVSLEALKDARARQPDSFDFTDFLRSSGAAYTDRDGVYPVTSAQDLFAWQPVLQRARAAELRSRGVLIWDDTSVWVGPEAVVAGGTALLPGTILRGSTTIDSDCTIGPNSLLQNAAVGCGAVINASHVYDSVVGARAVVGPFACLHPGTVLKDGASVGPFSETRNAALGENARMEGGGYLAEAVVGQGAFLGHGTVTAIPDETQSAKISLGDKVRVGANVTLRAPVELGSESCIAPGSAITENVPAQAISTACGRQVTQKESLRRQKKR